MIQSYSIQPSLNNAYARARRAKQHLTRFKRETRAFWRSFRPSKGYINPKAGGTIRIQLSQSLIPAMLGILIGETIYNLRATLDYLVYELAILDSGQIQKDTQFPIEDTESGWQLHMNGTKRGKVFDWGCYLRGLTPSHKACIKLLQPCYGCRWTDILRSVSNPDKHKTLTIVRATQTLSVKPVTKGPVFLNPSVEGKTTLFHVKINPKDETMDMNADLTFQIAFDDGLPVVETIEELHRQVIHVLDIFYPDFKK